MKNKINELTLITNMALACLLLVALVFCIPPVSANQIPGDPQDHMYYNNLTPQNDLYTIQAHMGDTLIIGKHYDMTGVLGWNNSFAFWNDWKIAGSDCSPDITVDFDYIRTGAQINPSNLYIDPAWARQGDWYQYEGCYDINTAPGAMGAKTGSDFEPYMHDDNLAFRLIDAPAAQETEVSSRTGITTSTIITYSTIPPSITPIVNLNVVPTSTPIPADIPQSQNNDRVPIAIGIITLIIIALWILYG